MVGGAKEEDHTPGTDSGHTSPRAELADATTFRRSASPAKRTAATMEGRKMKSDESSMQREATGQSLNTDAEAIGSDDEASEVDRRISQITELLQTPPEADEAGYLISRTWLDRVRARSSQRDSHDAKTASQAPIGPVDNSDIVPPGAFLAQNLIHDGTKNPFVLLLPDMIQGTHFEILTSAAWELILRWYGIPQDQKAIVRIARNTAPAGAVSNIVFENYPPIFTIRKMLSADNTSRPSTPTKAEDTMSSVKVAASRQEKYQHFLRRCKRAAGIQLDRKVRTWRHSSDASALPATDSATLAQENNQTAAQTPLLLISKTDFSKLVDGSAISRVQTEDHSNDPKYNGSATLETLELFEDQVLILEEQLCGRPGGEYLSDARSRKKAAPPTKATEASSQSGPTTRSKANHRGGGRKGNVGLINLGNTCYMNSALQCISRIEELAWYFLEQKWREEINYDNPLGHGGRMAKAYADLVSGLMAQGSSGAYHPRAFKGALSAAQPMFSGYGQQDSQEFLSFLVDALHEDLNRVLKKPYRENPDSDDAKVNDPEYIKELGEIYRDNHRARNDSIAMDLFNGFYKNTMVCPTCSKISVTFDPYSLVTLQLPIEQSWQHPVFFVPLTGKPVIRAVDMSRNATIKMLKKSLAAAAGIDDPQRLFVLEHFNHGVWKAWRDNESVSDISSTDVIVAYEIPVPPTNIRKGGAYEAPRTIAYGATATNSVPMDSPLADQMAVTVLHRTRKSVHAWALDYEPTVVIISREEARDYRAILRKILAAVATLTSKASADTDGTSLLRSVPDVMTSSESDFVEQNGAKLSDKSEDDYVQVTKSDLTATSSDEDGEPRHLNSDIERKIEKLFDVKYTRNKEGDFTLSPQNVSISAFSMKTRVRRASISKASVASIESVSTSSNDSMVHNEGPDTSSSATDVESDAEHLRTSFADNHFHGDVESDNDDGIMQPSEVIRGNPRNGRRRGRGKPDKFQRSTYGKRGGQRIRPSRPFTSRDSAEPEEQNSEDDPYYIKLGESICLDWTDEGWDALFGGDPREPEDPRGYMTLHKGFSETVKDPSIEEKLAKRNRRKIEGVSLEECFAETVKTEVLSEDNTWYCNRCKDMKQAEKTLMIWTAPDILVVHLKRFSGERYRRDKIDVTVDFPVEGLDLSDRIGLKEDGKEYIYDLFAVDNHYGGLGGGHYTALAKNFLDGKWYDFNDSHVSLLSGERIVSSAAYLLFYRRRSTQPLGPPALQELVNKARAPDSSSEDELALDNTSQAPPPYTTAGASQRSTGSILLPGRNTSAPPNDDDEGISMSCDTRLTAANNGTWSFDGLEAGAAAPELQNTDDADENLLSSVASDKADGRGEEGDADSMVLELEADGWADEEGADVKMDVEP